MARAAKRRFVIRPYRWPKLDANTWRLWLSKGTWTADQAALIFNNADPAHFNEAAFARDDISALRGTRAFLENALGDEPYHSASKSPDEWIQFALEIQLSVLPDVVDAMKQYYKPFAGAESIKTNDVGNWPWGEYETELLRHLAATAERYWKNYDPDDPSTAETKDVVVEWMVSQRGVSRRSAEAIDTILRAENLPKGPRKPRID